MSGACVAVCVMPASSMSATSTPLSVSGYGSGGSTADITTSATAASATGGAAPYTYAWAQYGTTPETWTIGAATSASTAFTATNIADGAIAFAYFKVTITDALGSKATAIVTATVNNGRPYPPQPQGNNGGGTGLQSFF